MLAWILRLFSRRPQRAVLPPRVARAPLAPIVAPATDPAPALPSAAPAQRVARAPNNLDRPQRLDRSLDRERPAGLDRPEAQGDAGHDLAGASERAAAGGGSVSRRDEELLERIEARLAEGKIELPYLPATSLGVIDLSSRPSVEVKDLVALIETDPVLSSELLKTANSAYYAGREPVDSLRSAIVRIGIRALRSWMFSLSIRGAVLRDRHLARYAEEVWRQACSVAAIARAIGPALGFDAERAFLLGLLHDIGKVPLLSMMRREVQKDSDVSDAAVGRMFLRHHEHAGALVAAAWRLPEEIASVAARHHRFRDNAEHPRAAALVSLAHQIDLQLSIGDELTSRGLVSLDEFEFLGASNELRHELVAKAEAAFQAQSQPAAA